ncbi:MAG: hypothetical protein LBC53_03380 [Spirochaetaceae bacterium]|jgi:hypothetical protein|nr:hypothetical protein [Spirochaetaceae bacterium]
MEKHGSIFLLLFFAVSLFGATGLFANGKKDGSQKEPVNGEWRIVITDAKTSKMPPSRASIGALWNRSFEKSASYIRRRSREESEAQYYENAEWLKEQGAAAKKLKSKQTERDMLYYKGLSSWQYKQQLKKIDKDMETLRKTLDLAEENRPVIEKLPHLVVKGSDANGVFTAAPSSGGENLFCSEQKADAFITSEVSMYHERIYIEIKLWTLYSRSFSYTDEIIFSMEDMNEASRELGARLIDAITGVYPSMLHITAEPDEAVITVDGEFAGRGETALLPRSAGDVNMTVFAPGNETAELTEELHEGDIVDVKLKLNPLPSMSFKVDVKNEEAASVYSGSFYTGRTPLVIQDTSEKNMNISVITQEGKTAGAVFKISEDPLTLTPKTPPKKGRVEKARKGFYGAWGRLWIILPVTWFAVGISDAYVNAFNGTYGERTQSQFETANYLYWGAGAAGILAGVFLTESLIRFIVYGSVAGKPVTALDP